MDRQWLRIASFGASTTVLGVLAITIPGARWTPDCVTAAILVGFSIAARSILPAPMSRDNHSDAPEIFLIGPMMVLHAAMITLSAAALWYGLSGGHTASWVADVLWLGSVVVGYAILRASTSLVAGAAGQTVNATDDPRAQWTATLRKLAVQVEQEPARRIIDSLSERTRYAARDYGVRQAAENQSITLLLNQLEPSITNEQDIARLARSIEVLLEQREQSLRAARTRA